MSEFPDHFRGDRDAEVFIGFFQDERLVPARRGFDHQDFRQVDDMRPGNLNEPGGVQFSREPGLCRPSPPWPATP